MHWLRVELKGLASVSNLLPDVDHTHYASRREEKLEKKISDDRRSSPGARGQR